MSYYRLVSVVLFHGVLRWVGTRDVDWSGRRLRGPLTFLEVSSAQILVGDCIEVLVRSSAVWYFAQVGGSWSVDLETSFSLAVR